MSDLWAAIAIAMIIEGMMPFISPQTWKEYLAKIQLLPNNAIRRIGLTVMLAGAVLLTLVR